MILTQLEEFRQTIYDCLGKAKDAVFELMDAVKTAPKHSIIRQPIRKSSVSARVAEYLCCTA